MLKARAWAVEIVADLLKLLPLQNEQGHQRRRVGAKGLYTHSMLHLWQQVLVQCSLRLNLSVRPAEANQNPEAIRTVEEK